MMTQYCQEAAKYGDVLMPLSSKPKRLIVILNPAANKRNAVESFEKYCEPILHLGGFFIEIVKTDSEGHARRYVEGLPNLPHAIIVAGGDGTLSETVTGLLRRSPNGSDTCPVGVLPVGRTNSIAHRFFTPVEHVSVRRDNARAMANAAIAIVRGSVEKKDVMRIEVLPDASDEAPPPRPVYAMAGFQWGAFRDVLSRRDKYWYTNGLREYVAFLFNAFASDVTWRCRAHLTYTDPCEGCRNCRTLVVEQQQPQSSRWWSKFVPRAKMGTAKVDGVDYSRKINEKCAATTEVEVEPVEVQLKTRTVLDGALSGKPKIQLAMGAIGMEGFSFLWDSWRRLWTDGDMQQGTSLEIRSLELRPADISSEEKEIYYLIDNEAYEVKPIRISLLPEMVPMYVLQKQQ